MKTMIRSREKAVGIFPNITKAGALELARKTIGWLRSHGYEGYLPPCIAAIAKQPECGLPISEWASSTMFAVILGGDGTLLSAARVLSPQGVPLLGVNLGHFGFLTELEAGEFFESFPVFLKGEGIKDDRLALDAKVLRGGRIVCHKLAVNEACVVKGPYGRMTVLTLSVSGMEVDTYFADGVIVSTPTGSTAYSLSAGGPVVAPPVEALTVTPICPHTLYARSLVIPVNETCEVEVAEPSRSTVLTVDGQEFFPLIRGDKVKVFASGVKVSLLRRPEWSFYDVLRRKMKEGAARPPR